MQTYSFKSIKILFESHGLLCFWTVKLIENAVIYSFSSLNDVFKHSCNFLLLYSLLYIPLFLADYGVLFFFEILLIIDSMPLLLCLPRLYHLEFLIYHVLFIGCSHLWTLLLWRHVRERASNLIAPWRRCLITPCRGNLVPVIFRHLLVVYFLLRYDWRGSNQIFINFPLL